MSCELSEKVSLLIDGELPPAETRAIEQHLTACGACQQMRADFLQLRQQISAYAVVRDPHAERRALAEVLAQQGAPNGARRWRERLLGSFSLPRFNPAFAAVAALLVVACVVGLFVYRNANRRTVVAVSAPTNSKQNSEAQVTTAAEAAANLNPREEVAHKEHAAPGTKGVEVGSNQPATANDRVRVPLNKRRAPAVNQQSQNASNKSPREQRPLERLPQPEQSAPSFVTATANAATIARVRPADAETLTLRHVEQAELLLRTFRNARAATGGAAGDLSYEKGRAQQLLYQNIVLRREATGAGNVQVATLLDSLEPILIDIANLPAETSAEDLRAIRERVQRKNLVALLQINSTALARAYE